MRSCVLVIAALLAGAAAAEPASRLFGAVERPAPGAPAPLGGYAGGCLAGGGALPESGPAWQAMRLSRNRNWGHPALIAFLERLGREAQALGWPGIWVGDLSQPRGGPMPSGHRSHQIGLDADVWLRPPDRLDLSREARERIGSTNMVRPDRRGVSAAFAPEHAAVLRAAAEDPAVARLFVNAAIKRRLCEVHAGEPWLRKVRPWWGHDHHTHIRLACPPGATACEDQVPPPPGDGCDASLDWWFTEEALNPPPRAGPPPPEKTLADLPPACAAVAAEP
jgi:penicillin-insensitive murein endopeptidase